MIYCESCRGKLDWMKTRGTVRGECEICHNLDRCYDYPTRRLPQEETIFQGVIVCQHGTRIELPCLNCTLTKRRMDSLVERVEHAVSIEEQRRAEYRDQRIRERQEET